MVRPARGVRSDGGHPVPTGGSLHQYMGQPVYGIWLVAHVHGMWSRDLVAHVCPPLRWPRWLMPLNVPEKEDGDSCAGDHAGPARAEVHPDIITVVRPKHRDLAVPVLDRSDWQLDSYFAHLAG